MIDHSYLSCHDWKRTSLAVFNHHVSTLVVIVIDQHTHLDVEMAPSLWHEWFFIQQHFTHESVQR